MQNRNLDLGQSNVGHGATGQELADVVVRRCVNAHLPRYLLTQDQALFFYLLFGIALTGLSGHLFGSGGVLVALPVSFFGLFVYCGLLGVFDIAPPFSEDENFAKEFAKPDHLRAMELELPPQEHALWSAKFRKHIKDGKAVTIQDLTDFANMLERERVNQTHLRAQQMIID